MEYVKKLLEEAKHSYRIYLELSDFENAKIKLSLLKWVDVAESAILTLTNDDTFDQLIGDLEQAAIMPIRLICESVYERVHELQGSPKMGGLPSEIASILSIEDVIEQKKELINVTNKMFKTLSILTKQEYPTIND